MSELVIGVLQVLRVHDFRLYFRGPVVLAQLLNHGGRVVGREELRCGVRLALFYYLSGHDTRATRVVPKVEVQMQSY